MAYSAEQKAMAIAIIKRHGGMTNQAVALVREALSAPGLSKSTLHGWLPSDFEPNRTSRTEPVEPNRTAKKETGAVVTPEVQALAEVALDDLFENVARTYIQHSLKDDVLKEVKGKEAVIAAATAVDKMRLLRDLPTEIVTIIPELMHALNAAGLRPYDTIRQMIQKANERVHLLQ